MVKAQVTKNLLFSTDSWKLLIQVNQLTFGIELNRKFFLNFLGNTRDYLKYICIYNHIY